MIGAPIGVEPWKATNHSDMTRPRMLGSAASCSVELAVDMNQMLAAPASASAISSRPRVGARAASRISSPKHATASTRVRTPVRPRVATTSPPATAPAPIAAVISP